MEENPDELNNNSEFSNQSDEEKSLTAAQKVINILLLIGLIILFITIVFFIIEFWPGSTENCDGENISMNCGFSIEQRYFIVVALGGALGAFIHAATSFTDFVGNKEFVYSWIPWYLMRPFLGSALALIFYIVIRGGLVSFEAGSLGPNVNPFGIMTVACLAGLFSKQAIDKLREIFENIFQLKKEVVRKDSLASDGMEKTKSQNEPSDDKPQG